MAEPGSHDIAPVGNAPSGPRRSIWQRPLALGFALVALLVAVLLGVIYKPLARPLLWAAALATLVYPAHRRLLDLLGGRATLAAVLSTILWLAVLAVPSGFVLNSLVDEARNLWPLLTTHLGADTFSRVAAWAQESPLGPSLRLALQVPREAGAAGLEARLQELVEQLGALVLQSVRDMTLGAPGALLRASVTIVIFFFFLRQGPRWVQRLREALPLEPAHADALLDTAARSIGAVFRGVLLTALSQAVLATLGYVVAGAPVPILLGSVTLVTALLPFVGAGAVWVPTAVGLFLSGRPGAAIGLALWGGLVVSLVDNFLRPYLIGRDIRLPMLWLFLSIVGGLQTFGLLGLLLGPAALALFMACYRILQQERSRPRPPASA